MAAFTAPNPNDRAAFNAHWGHILAGPSVTIQTIVVDGQVAGSVSSYMGDVGLEVTYWLGRDFWGRGIATTALAKFLTRHQTQRRRRQRRLYPRPGEVRLRAHQPRARLCQCPRDRDR